MHLEIVPHLEGVEPQLSKVRGGIAHQEENKIPGLDMMMKLIGICRYS